MFEKTIFDRILSIGLPLGEYAVFGSALLQVFGIRTAADLDIIVTPELFEELRNQEGWEEKHGNGFLKLEKGEASVTTVQDKPTDGDYNPERLRLIREAVIISGCPFVRIQEVVACKLAYDREKDRRDVEALRPYLEASNKGRDIYRV